MKEENEMLIKKARERQPLVEKGWKLGIKGMELMDEQMLKDEISRKEAGKSPRRRLNLE